MQTEDISRLIGQNTGITVYEVEKGAIRRFAEAVGDMNPLYHNDEFARESIYSGIIAPPGFFGWPINRSTESALMVEFPSELVVAMEKEGYPLASALDGGIEYEYFLPVHAGDVLTSVSTLKSLRERAGKMVIFMMETVFQNHSGAKVATIEAQYILRHFSTLSKNSGEPANA